MNKQTTNSILTVASTQALQELHTFKDMLRWGTSQLNAANLFFGHGNTTAWDETLCLLRHVLHLTADEDRHVMDARLLFEERQKIATLLQRRIQERKPIPYLIQEAWFAGLAFYVDERVLIPRSPIAELIEQRFAPWFENNAPSHILDLCTGSGCIAIAMALQFPDAKIDASDISQDALAVAQRNIAYYGLEKNVNLIHADLLRDLPPKKYDLIIANPPYVDELEMANLPLEYRHEPVIALAGGSDGLYLVEKILGTAAAYLSAEGILIVEVGHSAKAAETRFARYPFTWLSFERGGEGVFLLTREQLI